MLKFRFCRYLLSVIIIAALIGMAGIFIPVPSLTKPLTHQKILSDDENSTYFLKIEGFKFNRCENGDDVLSINADKFTIEKKKLGFFRVGLIHDAVFDNATIDVYQKKKTAFNNAHTPENALSSLKDALPSFTSKRISSIIISPLRLDFRDEKTVFTRIVSDYATIKLPGRNICFNGNVKVLWGDKLLKTNHLVLSFENSILKTDRHVILKNTAKNKKVDTINLDLFLNAVKNKAVGLHASDIHDARPLQQ